MDPIGCCNDIPQLHPSGIEAAALFSPEVSNFGNYIIDRYQHRSVDQLATVNSLVPL